jgi:hypothetical protein
MPAREGDFRGRWSLFLFILAAIGVLCGYVLLRLAAWWLARRLGLLAWLGIVMGGFVVLLLGVVLYRRWAWWALSRWAERDGWTRTTGRRDWPWTSMEPGVPAPVVQVALSKSVDGFSVTVGEVTWASGGMLDVAGSARGHGFFAVLRLPHRYSRLGVRRKLHEQIVEPSGIPENEQPENPPGLVTNAAAQAHDPGRDEFDRQYWTICADADMALNHVGADIKAAHLARSLPDWMLVEDELYVVARTLRPLTPSAATDITRQVRRIADLLALTRD